MYPEINVKYKNGRDPELIIYYNDGREERIDLTEYNNKDMIINLLNKKGFEKNTSKKNKIENCHSLVSTGECTKNPDFMGMYCKYSCLKYEL